MLGKPFVPAVGIICVGVCNLVIRLNTFAMAVMSVALVSCAAYRPLPLETSLGSDLTAPKMGASLGSEALLLTPSAIAAIVVVANPELKAARARAGVAEAQIFAAGLLPDPVVNLSFDKILSGPDMFSGYGAQIVYDLMAFRDRKAALSIQKEARDQARLDVAWLEWQTLGQARILASRLSSLEDALRLLDASEAITTRIFFRAQVAFARGDIRVDELQSRRIAALDAADKVRQLKKDLSSTRSHLNQLLGLPPDISLQVAPESLQLAHLDEKDLISSALANRLDLRALQAGYRSQEASLKKATGEAFPSLQLTLAATRDTADNHTFGPAATLTLPVWNRNAGAIAIAKATRQELKAEYESRVLSARAEIHEMAERVNSTLAERLTLRESLKVFETMTRNSEAAAKQGDLSEAAADAAVQALADRRVAIAALDQSILETEAALEVAVGSPLKRPNSDRAD